MNLSIENCGWGPSSPPIDLVVVRDTPPRVRHASDSFWSSSEAATEDDDDDNDHRRFQPEDPQQRVLASLPTSSAFRLQPRGKLHMPTPSPSSRGVAPRGRKRGANCLAGTLDSAVVTSSGLSTSGLLINNSYRSQLGDENLATESTPREFMVDSPSRVENALQLLSLQSPTPTPVVLRAGRQSSPFQLYSSISPGVILRPRAESLGSMKSCSTTTSRSSHKTAPVHILRHLPSSSSVVTSLDHATTIRATEEVDVVVVVVDPLMTPAPVPAVSVTPKHGGTICSIGRSCDNDEVMHSTPQSSHWSDHMVPSPFSTPLPKVKLTPRKHRMMRLSSPPSTSSEQQQRSRTDNIQPFTSPAVDASFLLGWPDYLPPSGSLSLSDSNNKCPSQQQQQTLSSSSYPSPAECVPTPSNKDSNGRRRTTTMAYLLSDNNNGPDQDEYHTVRRSLFSNRPPLFVDRNTTTTVSGTAKNNVANKVSIRSLLTTPLSPSAFRSMTATAANDRDCDGSLTDDDDDEPFVLADPAALVQEQQDHHCHQHELGEEDQTHQQRPYQRRRMSMEGSNDGVVAVGTGTGSLLSDNILNGQSTTSLIGMAFVQGDYNYHGHSGSSSNLHLSSKLSLTISRDCSPSDQHASTATNGKDDDPNNFHSIGLDLDPDSTTTATDDQAMKEIADGATMDLQDRDLHTPPALERTTMDMPFSPPAPPRTVSYSNKCNDEIARASSPVTFSLSPERSVSYHERRSAVSFSLVSAAVPASSSAFLSLADRSDVQRTVADMIMTTQGG
jgi:hypothetical protein